MARRAALTISLTLLAHLAGACPLCHTPTGQQVRAGIFGAGFLRNVLFSAAPFPFFAAVVALVYFRFPAAHAGKAGS
jgi:hypothetical protein